jgi:outer membrane protein OmpA-like peptidoglycan-associated protein
MKTITLTIILLLFFKSAFSQCELIKTIYFKKNSFKIEKKYYVRLNQIISKYKSDSSYFIKIFGFSDTTGSDKYDDWIAGKRVDEVYNYLNSHSKINLASYYGTGWGKAEYDYDLHFESAHVQKRCVDIWIMFSKKKNK